MLGVMPCPCGRCLPCLMNRRRMWAHRILLESFKHKESCFVTLTYDDAHLPEGGSLCPEDYQLWLRSVRDSVRPIKIRFFLAGEYGDTSWRPHYHVAIFGIGSVLMGGRDGWSGLAKKFWTKGHVFVGSLTEQSARYIAGYVTKKFKFIQKEVLLNGRHPEFCRMSLRPGIGAEAMSDVVRSIRALGVKRVLQDGDVPSQLRHGMRDLPLGRYLRRKLREYMGFDSADAPEQTRETYLAEMRALRKVETATASALARQGKFSSTYEIMLDKDGQKLRNMVARFKIFDSKKTI